MAEEHRVLWVIAGCIGFGVLMGMRTELDAWWQRTLVAAVAGAVLALMLFPLRSKQGR